MRISFRVATPSSAAAAGVRTSARVSYGPRGVRPKTCSSKSARISGLRTSRQTVELSGGPSPYSEVTVDDDGRVLRFREKPADPRTDLSAIALYFFPASDLAMLDEYLAQGDHDAPGHFLAWLVERVPVYARPLESRWYDIGSLDSFAEAKRRFEGSDPFWDVAG
jgi:NDP-sugar pyrophosphorylase family protein